MSVAALRSLTELKDAIQCVAKTAKLWLRDSCHTERNSAKRNQKF